MQLNRVVDALENFAHALIVPMDIGMHNGNAAITGHSAKMGKHGFTQAPARVLHRLEDKAIKVGAGRFLASRISAARYVELPGQDHWWWIGDGNAILDGVERFSARL